MMRYYIHLFLLVIIISCDSENKFEAPAESHFIKFYGEDGNHEGVDFVLNSDGSYILLGNEQVDGATLGQQIYLVKVDALGTVVWQKTFGLAGDEFGKDIELTTDGRIIVAAESQKGLNDRDVYLKTLSQEGAPLDSVRIGLKTINNQESDEEVTSISIIQDGFIVSGSTTAVKTLKSAKPNDTKDALHLRFTSALDLIDENTGLWNYTTELDDSEDVLVKMIEINSSTYYGFGYTNTIRNSNRDYKYWVFRLGSAGDASDNGTELLDIIGNPLTDEKLGDIITSSNSAGEAEFVLNGIKTTSSDANQSFLIKLQKNPFRPPNIPRDVVFNPVIAIETPTDLGQDVGGNTRIARLSSGDFLLLSNSKLLSNDKLNISLIKLNNNLLKVWQVPLFFGGAGDDFAGTVTELPDGKIVIIGTMTLGGVTGQTKMVLMKLTSEGKLSD